MSYEINIVRMPVTTAAVGLFESACRPTINVLIIFEGFVVCSWGWITGTLGR